MSQLAGCVVSKDNVGEIVYRLEELRIPNNWKSSGVVVLQYDTFLDFIPSSGGNRVIEKEVKWYKVYKRDYSGIETLTIAENTLLEKPVKVDATAFYPDGSRWQLSQAKIKHYSEPIHNTKILSFQIPKYQKGILVKVEIEREYLQPEFFGRYYLCDELPVWQRNIELTYPKGVTIKNGVVNTKNRDIAYSIILEDDKRKTLISGKKIWDFRSPENVMFPEKYYPTFYASFPPRGNTSYTWQELGDHYLNLAEKVTESIVEIDDIVQSFGTLPQDEMVKKSFDTVIKKIRYYGDWRGRFAIYPRKAVDVLKNGYGDCKELSTILKSFLEPAGIETSYVLLSTSGNPQPLKDYPYLGSFNHMILSARTSSGKLYFLDPTHFWGTAKNSYYPSIGRTALILSPHSSYLKKIEKSEAFQNEVITHSDVKYIKGEDRWVIQGDIKLKGHAALRLFEHLKWSGHANEKQFSQDYIEKYFDVHASSVELLMSSSDVIKIRFVADYDEKYVSMGAGGIRLELPSLFKQHANPELSDNYGIVYMENFTQKDSWSLPFSVEDAKLPSYSTYMNSCEWETKDNRVARVYIQKGMEKDNDGDTLKYWGDYLRSLKNAVVWK